MKTAAVLSGRAQAAWRKRNADQAPHDFLDELYGPRRDALLAELDRVVESIAAVARLAGGDKANGVAPNIEAADQHAQVLDRLTSVLTKASAVFRNLHHIDAHNNRSAPPSPAAELETARRLESNTVVVPGDVEQVG